MINVEGHAAHCRMASTITIRVIKRQHRRSQHEMRVLMRTPGHEMSGRLRYDEATSYGRGETRLDGFLFFKFLSWRS